MGMIMFSGPVGSFVLSFECDLCLHGLAQDVIMLIMLLYLIKKRSIMISLEVLSFKAWLVLGEKKKEEHTFYI